MVEESKKATELLVMDSGAFSAWAKGIEIDFDDYIDYLHMYEKEIDVIVNLDCIPASPGVKKITPEQRERSAKKGWLNYKRLIREGFSKEKVVHVFHQGESFHWLKKMVKEIPYIGLSPANDRTTSEKIQWLDKCMNYVLDENGFPKVKFHGFAVTSTRIMKRYPWYSVDSSSWCVLAGYGKIWIPKQKNGCYDWSAQPDMIFVSRMVAVPRQLEEYANYLGLKVGRSEIVQVDENYVLQPNERMVSELRTNGKLKVERIVESGIINDHLVRAKINAIFIDKFMEAMPQWPWSFNSQKKTLFTSGE